MLKSGADKVSVNSGAIRNPDLIYQAAKRYGDQCVVLSVDVKRVDGVFRVFAKLGIEPAELLFGFFLAAEYLNDLLSVYHFLDIAVY